MLKLFKNKGTLLFLVVVVIIIVFILTWRLRNRYMEVYTNPMKIIDYKRYKVINTTPVDISKYITIPIFIINLRSRKDRKEHMVKLMKELNFKNYMFIEPVSLEKTLDFAARIGINTAVIKEKQTILKPLSLIATNINILENFKASYPNNNKFIIMEDDIKVYSKENINDILLNSEKVMYDQFHLEFCNGHCSKFKKIYDNVYKLHGKVHCAAAIVYDIKIIDKIVQFFYSSKNIKSMNDCFNMNLMAGWPCGLHHWDWLLDSFYNNSNYNRYGYPYFRQKEDLGSDLDWGNPRENDVFLTDLCSENMFYN